MKVLLSAAFAAILCLTPVPSYAASCGGSWSQFIDGIRQEARQKGINNAAIERVLAVARQDAKVLKADRSQGVFRQSFLTFSGRAVSADRLRRGKEMRKRHAKTFARVEREYGIPPEVILAFWAMETDYGAVMGNTHTISALATLSHDCRRPELFRPQFLAAIELHANGGLNVNETGAWAGEIGHVQMLPGDILRRGRDGDGDGRVTIKTSPQDAILSAASMLDDHGWRSGEPWLIEVTAPADLDWAMSGLDKTRSVLNWKRDGVRARSGALPNGALQASLIVPQGRKGPKFLAFHNFTKVYLEWNKSLVNTTTAAYLATRIGGAKPYLKGNPDPAFNADEMMELQRRLVRRGHDVGAIDGILGRLTRAAVRAEQTRLGAPADGWPTQNLFRQLR